MVMDDAAALLIPEAVARFRKTAALIRRAGRRPNGREYDPVGMMEADLRMIAGVLQQEAALLGFDFEPFAALWGKMQLPGEPLDPELAAASELVSRVEAAIEKPPVKRRRRGPTEKTKALIDWLEKNGRDYDEAVSLGLARNVDVARKHWSNHLNKKRESCER